MPPKNVTPQVRELVDALSGGGKEMVSTQAICAAAGAEDDKEKAKVREALRNMVKRGELVRRRPGVFSFRAQAAQNVKQHSESYQRMWRIIRTENAGWTVAHICSTTRVPSTTVSEYVRWLYKEGFIALCGKDGRARLYRSTGKARAQREAPYPPRTRPDAFAPARSAVCRLVRIFMEPEPSARLDEAEAQCRTIMDNLKNNQSV